MSRTTVLFVCHDNALLGPLAEGYLNFRGNGLIRAFSAGIEPAVHLNRHVRRLLSACGAQARGLAPKPIDIFLMPHAIVPDRVIYLSDMEAAALPPLWRTTTSSHWWRIAGKPPFGESFAASADCFARIRQSIDLLVQPRRISAPGTA